MSRFLLPFVLATAVAVLLSTAVPTSVAAQQFIELDLSAATSVSSIPLPKSVIGVTAADFGRAFPTTPFSVELRALPIENAHGCTKAALPSRLAGESPRVLLVHRGNCTAVEKARLAQAAGAVGVLIVNDERNAELPVFAANNATLSAGITIYAAALSYEDGSVLIASSLDVPMDENLRKHDPPQPNVIIGVQMRGLVESSGRAFDMSFLLMLIVATTTVMYAAYLSSVDARAAKDERNGTPQVARPAIAGEGTVAPQYLTIQHAAMFIAIASVFLVVLYFFIEYLIYVILIIFCLGALQAMTHLGTMLLRWLKPDYTRTVVLPVLNTEASVYTVVSFVGAFILTVWWLATRNGPHAWVLQDFLGISLLLVLQLSVRLPDIRVSTVLLSMAFLYDIFWVFISSRIFKSSVMVTVAQGGNTGEAVPMLLRLPRADDSGGYSMLGLGDIALPGLFISYLLRFDYGHPSTTRTWKQSYFIIGSVGYAIGLVCTYIALMVSSNGQPALLYLVPCTLGVVLPIAWRRGDLHEMWFGAAAPPGPALDALRSRSRTKGKYAAVTGQTGETGGPDDASADEEAMHAPADEELEPDLEDATGHMAADQHLDSEIELALGDDDPATAADFESELDAEEKAALEQL